MNKVYATTDATEYFERLSLDHCEECWSLLAMVEIGKSGENEKTPKATKFNSSVLRLNVKISFSQLERLAAFHSLKH